MDSSLTAKARRQVTLIAGLAVPLLVVGGILTGTASFIVTMVGVAGAVIGWVYALFIALRAKSNDWVLMLGLGLVVTLALAAYAFLTADPSTQYSGPLGAAQLGFFVLAFIAIAFSALGGDAAIARGVAAFFGGWGLLSLVIGGTLVGGAIGTKIGSAAENVTSLGFHLYVVAGVLGALAWVIGIIVGARTRAWGWFTLVVLLPAIGAFMFGLFGPTRQDVVMAQENARQRRAVGLS